MRLRRIVPVTLAMLALVLAPARASAQTTQTAPPSTSSQSTSAQTTTTSAPRTEESQSEVGGSSARITRGGDATTRPVRSTRADEEAEVPVNEEDDGRKADFIWLEVEGGVSYVDLIALQQSDDFSTSLEAVRGVGPMFGAALGFRVFFLAIGARATIASYPGFEIGTVGGEVQFRLPTPVVEPWIRVGAGYAWQGNADYAEPTQSTPTVYGWMLNAGLGLDIFVTWWLSIGIGGSLDYLNMTRQSDPRVDCMMVTSFCPEQDGDAIGVQGRGTVQAGLHF